VNTRRLSGRAPSRDSPVLVVRLPPASPGLADGQRRRTRITTTRSAGHMHSTRRTSGPSRSHRTSAARATARSCTRPPASRRRGDPAAVRAALRRDDTPVRELGRQHQEQNGRRHRGDRGAGRGRAGRDHRPGPQHRPLEPLLLETKLRDCYSLLGVQRFCVGSATEIPAGTSQVPAQGSGPGLSPRIGTQ